MALSFLLSHCIPWPGIVRFRRWGLSSVLLCRVLLSIPLIAYCPLAMRVVAGGPPLPTIGSSSLTRISDLSFSDARYGWVLGTACDSARRCGSALRHTLDGGRTWSILPYRPAGALSAVSHLAFINRHDGWAYGPGLSVTHDGGRIWTVIPHQGTVLAVAPMGELLLRVDGLCASACTAHVWISFDQGGAWTPQGTRHPGLDAYSQGVDAQLIPTSATDAYLLSCCAYDHAAGNQIIFQAALLVTHDGGTTWDHRVDPCATPRWLTRRLAALPHGQLWLICGSQPATIMQDKVLYWSPDAGRHWQLIAETDPLQNGQHGHSGTLPVNGSIAPYSGQLTMTTPHQGWMILARWNYFETWDGGRTWRAPISGQRDDAGAGDVGPAFFSDPQHGWLAAGSTVFRTTDGGRHWTASLLP